MSRFKSMLRISLLIFLLVSQSIIVKSQPYIPSFLPDSLKIGANAIVWTDETAVVINKDLKAEVSTHIVITILNERGDRLAHYFGYYNEFWQMKEVHGNVYNAFGAKIASFKKKDLEDEPEEDGFSLVTSTRLKHKDLSQRNYPYTVEIFEEDHMEGFVNLPPFRPFPSEGVSLVKASYDLQTSGNCSIRYYGINGISAPLKEENSSGSQKLHWEVKQQKARTYDLFRNEGANSLPKVLIMADRFEYGGYTGRSDSWKNFGLYFWNMNKGRDLLPENLQVEIHKLANPYSSIKEKTIVLYKWMQGHTRYINVALGLGGMQPFEAAQVADKKYGDCKGLNNYMCSILKEAGIESYYCLVAAGSNNRNTAIDEFPYDYFNHIITCVPNNGDTLWLECTSQTNPPGFLGSFTGDRKALVLKETGGEWVNTRHYSYSDNSQVRTVRASMDQEGVLSIQSDTHFEGLKQELPSSLLHHKSEKERMEYLNTHLNLPTFVLQKAQYKVPDKNASGIDESLDLKVSGYATMSGKRIFITPNIFNKSTKPVLPDSITTYMILETGSYEKDSVVINLPEEYTIESMPAGVSLPSIFGNYTIGFSFESGVLRMKREQTEFSGRFLKDKFPAYKKWQEAIYKADQLKVVLVKK